MSMENWGLSGHEWAVEMLKEHIRRGSVRHAYLICGPAGIGRRTLALRFAQALNCPNRKETTEPCGKCKTCQQIERMQYADLSVIQAEKEGGTLKVEQVRAIRQSLVLKPYQGKYRLALFLRFEEANASSANALLKTLEEAPSHAILILTAGSPEQLLPTIVSRCELLRLRPLKVEEVEAYLKDYHAEPATAKLLAHVSSGRPGFALRLMQDPKAQAFRSKRLEDLNRLLKSNRVERFAYAERLTERRREAEERFRETLQVWLSFWRDVLLCTGGTSTALVNIDHREDIEALGKKLSLQDARQLVSGTEDAIDRLEKNVNARLLAEVLLLDWPHE
jgi:DNA polymerase-3 subunit delta'